jgi:SAM-dependent methyltransferase
MSDPQAAGYAPQALLPRARSAVAQRGARPVAGDLARWGTNLVGGLPRTLAPAPARHFTLEGTAYPYLFHRYKVTWLTERAVEVPVAQAVVDRYAERRVLEVGNVLSHYRPQSHVIVDKYERAPGVLNRDVLDLGDLGQFDLVVAISTLEHVGWDEHPRDPGKALEAIAALRALLAPRGVLLVTVPVGYNPTFDAAFRERRIELARCAALRRQAPGAHWREVPTGAIWSAPYDFLLYSARAVLFAWLERAG